MRISLEAQQARAGGNLSAISSSSISSGSGVAIRPRVNKPFRIYNLSVLLVLMHEMPSMIGNERRKRKLALLDDSGSDLFRDLLAILGR